MLILEHLHDPFAENIHKTAKDDNTYYERHLFAPGFPADREEASTSLWDYWTIKESFVRDDGLILLGMPSIIPAGIRHEVLSLLHDPSQ